MNGEVKPGAAMIGLCALLLCCSLLPCGARTWTDILPHHGLAVLDVRILSEVVENDPLRFTAMPSHHPSSLPSFEPSMIPTSSLAPTKSPVIPTPSPTGSPTPNPTTAPPTPNPTPRPTEVKYPPNDPPTNPRATYFNYDTNFNAKYGPGYPQTVKHNATVDKFVFENNAWANVNVARNYWTEFGAKANGTWSNVLSIRQPQKNRCGRVGSQSPIDIQVSPGAVCYEHHQIRTRRGDYTLSSESRAIKAQILPNKMRLLFQRRPCADITKKECEEPDPPHADFPHNWGNFVDVLHVDFKLPSEHLVYGKRFDGEMQIYHLHPGRRRAPVVSVLMKVSDNGFINWELQKVIQQLQFAYNADLVECSKKQRRERRALSLIHDVLGRPRSINDPTSATIDYATWADYSTFDEDPSIGDEQRHRKLQGIFTPHHSELVPSIHFFGYAGSTTDPPCGEWVHWFVIDKPMEMSYSQYETLRRLQFTHVGPNCERTSVHHQESNARPVQDTFGRAVYHCTSRDFVADSEKIV